MPRQLKPLAIVVCRMIVPVRQRQGRTFQALKRKVTAAPGIGERSTSANDWHLAIIGPLTLACIQLVVRSPP